jgi:phosphoglycolate phosphatase-like HAD superfamily hydrolase
MNLSFLDQYEVIIFDCDGVLIDVNKLKCDAFGKAVEGYSSEVVESFVKHCRNTFGVSRYIKFKEFLIDFANESFNEEKYNILLNNYSTICKDIYGLADITPGCENLLTELSKFNKNLYVSSGSDEEELNEIFRFRNLNKYFDGIYGSPKTKSECTAIILNNHPNKKAVFVGDALSDMKTAKELGIDFIYMSIFTVQSKEQDLLCKKEAIKVIGTLEELISSNTTYV